MNWQPPNITALNARLAEQNRRVEKYLEGVLGCLDQLIDAALSQDWGAVRRLSQEVSQFGAACQETGILESAESLLEAAHRADNEAELKHCVMNLIAACGKAQRRAKMS
jgi:hypothetical protein